MTMMDQELVPAFLYESLPKPTEWIPDKDEPAWYPGVVWQSPPAGPPSAAKPRTEYRRSAAVPRTPTASAKPRPPAPPRPVPAPPPGHPAPERSRWSLTAEQLRRVHELQRAYEAEEAIPDEHLPKRRLRLVLWKFLPVLWLVARCRHCGQSWPCHSLTRQLRKEQGPDIGLAVYRLSTRRLRERSLRRNPSAITHKRKPQRLHRKERALGLR